MATKKEEVTYTSIEASPLWADIRDIMQAKKSCTRWIYKATLHTEKEDVETHQVLDWPEHRDYAGNVGASAHTSFNMGLGDYEYILYPYREHLEVTMKSIGLDDTGKEIKGSAVTQRYKAVFHPDKNPVVVAGKDALQNKDTLNRAQMVKVVLELQNRQFEPLLRKMTGGTYRGITAERMIRSAMMHESSMVQVDGKPCADGVEMDPADNTETQSEIVVPDGTRIVNLPTWCQEKGCGLYATGIGTFFQRYEDKNLWFVFPLYRFSKFDTAKKKMVIFNVPNGRFNGVDKTYKLEADILKIISVNGADIQDDALNTELNEGFGFRMVNGKSVMAKPVELKDGKAVFSRAKTVTEVGHKARKDTLQYAPVVKPTNNNFSQYSKAWKSHSSHITLVWENADPSLLFPGMALKYVYLAHGKYMEKKGILTGVFVNRNLQGRPGTGQVYSTHVTMSILLESKEEVYT